MKQSIMESERMASLRDLKPKDSEPAKHGEGNAEEGGRSTGVLTSAYTVTAKDRDVRITAVDVSSILAVNGCVDFNHLIKRSRPIITGLVFQQLHTGPD